MYLTFVSLYVNSISAFLQFEGTFIHYCKSLTLCVAFTTVLFVYLVLYAYST